jgi:hypothetical protein
MPTEPCRELTRADGTPLDNELVPHFSTFEETAEEIRATDEEDGQLFGARQRQTVCLLIHCDICGDELEDDGGANHFTRDQAVQAVDAAGWIPIPVGTGQICPNCHAELIISVGAPVIAGQEVAF